MFRRKTTNELKVQDEFAKSEDRGKSGCNIRKDYEDLVNEVERLVAKEVSAVITGAHGEASAGVGHSV